MLQITRPDLLFAKQKVFNITTGVENPKPIGIQGKKGSETVILYSFTSREILGGEERTQLFKILTACKLTESEVTLVNLAFAPQASVSWLRSQFPVKTLIIFGDLPVGRNLRVSKNHTFNIDGINVIRSESLTTLLTSAADKKALWEELKIVFGV